MLSLINRRSVNKSTITMKKFFPILLLLMAGSAVHAGGLSTRHQTSLQFINDGGHTESTRMGASYSISGTNATGTEPSYILLAMRTNRADAFSFVAEGSGKLDLKQFKTKFGLNY